MKTTKIEREFIKKLQDKFSDENTNKIYIRGLGVFTVRSRKIPSNKMTGLEKSIDRNWISFRAALPLKRVIN